MKIGQIAKSASTILWRSLWRTYILNLVIVSKKSREEIGFKCFMTFDLYLGQIKGQRKKLYQKIFSPGSQVSCYEWILAISSWDFTIRTFICPFFSTFSVIIPWQHDMSGHRSGYELLGPWPMCPASFIEISWKLGQNSALSNGKQKKNNNSVHETREEQDPIPLLGEWDNNNSVDETREEQDPIPLWGMG